ncbi:hypothetical protein AB0K51_18335 [Kitasatospora sp. NPDC049285]|uniref:hypothetical protein n=1 Tax=Kitasatospora sp. NPDC049285 TaxID=3157096 RepID=UPI00343FC7E4
MIVALFEWQVLAGSHYTEAYDEDPLAVALALENRNVWWSPMLYPEAGIPEDVAGRARRSSST